MALGTALKVLGGFILVPLTVWIALAIRRKHKYRARPFKNAMIETVFLPFRLFRIGLFKSPFTLESTIAQAKEKTGLADLGDLAFMDVYKNIMEQSHAQKRQHNSNLGVLIASGELTNTWIRRLKMIQYLKDVPDVLNVNVPSPVFILGLPRSGTTYIHRLLSLDPHTRAPLLWELQYPVPGCSPAAS